MPVILDIFGLAGGGGGAGLWERRKGGDPDVCGGSGRRARERAERPMDEEDSAAPVGGDRGRGPGGLGSLWSLRREVEGPGPGLRGHRRGLAVGSRGLQPQDPRPALGPGDTGRSHTDELDPLP